MQNIPIIAENSVGQHCYRTSLDPCYMPVTTSFLAALHCKLQESVGSTYYLLFPHLPFSPQSTPFRPFISTTSPNTFFAGSLIIHICPSQWLMSSPGPSSQLCGMLWVTVSLFIHFFFCASRRHCLGSPPT